MHAPNKSIPNGNVFRQANLNLDSEMNDMRFPTAIQVVNKAYLLYRMLEIDGMLRPDLESIRRPSEHNQGASRRYT